MATRARRLLAIILFVAAIAVLSPVWLGWMGAFLVHADPPAPADAAVVLAGDASGRRILMGAELVKQGYVPKVLVSGPAGIYGLYESELAIAFAVKRGCPEDWFVPVPMKSHSTTEEAQVLVRELRRRGIKRLLLVTSNYHTRRAGHIFRKAAPDLNIRVVAASDQFFNADGWWRTREGRKQAFFEWSKTVADWMGM
ncbi:MAG: YdcF family protein [Bryobacterales bacterium]|nr:YdcF family protein [Bryobacterales bacterium]